MYSDANVRKIKQSPAQITLLLYLDVDSHTFNN